MKTELCAFSGFKIYPGHGKRMVKADLRVSLQEKRARQYMHIFKEKKNWKKNSDKWQKNQIKSNQKTHDEMFFLFSIVHNCLPRE